MYYPPVTEEGERGHWRITGEVIPLARIFHELLAAITDMAVLPGVLGCRPLRRTVQVRLGTNPAVRGTVTRWHAHLRSLATAIHEMSGLVLDA